MEEKLKRLLKSVKLNETTVSTVMGGVVVLVVAILMFNYFKSINQKPEGTITEPAGVVEVKEGEKPNHLPITYKVEMGDNLWTIAEKFYKSGYNFVDIADANKLQDPDHLEVGQELDIPQVAVKKITVLETAKVNNLIETDTYTTVAGDHLWGIAVRAYGDGYAWTKIYETNKKVIGANPGRLYKGVALTLPR